MLTARIAVELIEHFVCKRICLDFRIPSWNEAVRRGLR